MALGRVKCSVSKRRALALVGSRDRWQSPTRGAGQTTVRTALSHLLPSFTLMLQFVVLIRFNLDEIRYESVLGVFRNPLTSGRLALI